CVGHFRLQGCRHGGHRPGAVPRDGEARRRPRRPLGAPGGHPRGDPGDSRAAPLAAPGAQPETIPPSLILITLGSVTGMSIAALFTGGLLPGAVLGLALCVVVWWRSRGAVPSARAT